MLPGWPSLNLAARQIEVANRPWRKLPGNVSLVVYSGEIDTGCEAERKNAEGQEPVSQAHRTLTSGSTDIPGRSKPSLLKSGLSLPSKSMRTGRRCTTFT